jgi:hypothetical protein
MQDRGSGGVGRARLAFIVTLALASCGAPGGPAAQDPVGSLVMQAGSATLVYRDPEQFRLEVSFHNESRAPVIVLSSGIRRVYRPLRNGTAERVAFPGPRLSPWRGSFLLASGESRSVVLLGMRDGDGIWRLTPGAYELTVCLQVPAEPGDPPQTELAPPGTRVWHGELVARPISVAYEP